MMPIRMICEKRHHLGESDINYPAIFCDCCSERIDDAAKAGYYYKHPERPEESSKDWHYEQKMPVYFLHHNCYYRMKATYNKEGHFGVETEFGIFKSENILTFSSWGNLPAFPIFLGRNMGMEINANSAWSCQFNEQQGTEISKDTYPPHPDGYVYFIVDNDCITRKVKVGFSGDVHGRLKDLQVGSPAVLKCYGAIRGTKEDEALAHRILKEHRSHGEWFVFQKAFKVIDQWIDNQKICEIINE